MFQLTWIVQLVTGKGVHALRKTRTHDYDVTAIQNRITRILKINK
jgi:hypothetical protein